MPYMILEIRRSEFEPGFLSSRKKTWILFNLDKSFNLSEVQLASLSNNDKYSSYIIDLELNENTPTLLYSKFPHLRI